MSDVPLNIKLVTIGYSGVSVGETWSFTIAAGGQTTTLAKTIPFGATVSLDRSIFKGTIEINGNNAIPIPIAINAMEDDPTYDDMGGVSGTFNITPALLSEGQALALVVSVRESRGSKPPTQGATAILTFNFTAIREDAPMLTSVMPVRGPIAGGTPLTIFGENFAQGCTARLGGVDAGPVTFVDNRQIMVTTPRQTMPGPVNVRVANPAGRSGALAKAFQYDGPPLIQKVTPDEGPAQQDPDSPQVVTLIGASFQSGAIVMFGKVASSQVELLKADGTQLSAQVPTSDKTGPVRVEVRNPDGQTGSLREGFIYLGPKQAAQARISKVEPLTILEDTPSLVTLRGRNLDKAVNEGTLAVRGPGRDVARIKVENLNVQPAGESQEYIVTFSLRVTALKEGGLDLLERLPLQIVASVRPNAKKDLLTESSRGMLTVVPKALPVPMGFTAQLKKGGANLVMVAGRNLRGTRLEVTGASGSIPVESQKVEDGMVFGLVNVDSAASSAYSLRLVDAAFGNEISQLPLSLANASEPVPGDMPENPDLQLQPVPGQRLVGAGANRTEAVDLTTGKYLEVGSPVLDSRFLIPGIPFQIASTGFEIPLFDEVRLLPFFDRGGDVLVDLPINVKVGRIFGIRALSLLLVVRVSLQVQISVALVAVFDPFNDVDFEQPFNEFSDVLPDPFSGFPGAILFELQVSVDVTLSVSFLLGLLQPDGGLIELASAGLTLKAGTSGFELDTGVSFLPVIRSVRPLDGAFDRVRHLPTQMPFMDDYGYWGFYFAEAQGQACLPWEFDFTLTRFASGSEPEVAQTTFTPFLCLSVNRNPNPLLKIHIDPPFLQLDVGERGKFAARDQDNNLLDSPKPVRFDLEEGSPAVATVLEDGSVTGLVQGAAVVRALATTQSKGFALFPSPDLNFVVDRFLAVGLPPHAIVDYAPVGVAKTVVAVDYDGLTQFFLERDEPIGMPSQKMPLELKFKLPDGAKVKQDVPIKIKIAVQTFIDPLSNIFSGSLPNRENPAVGRTKLTPEERFMRFFASNFKLGEELSFTLKAGSDQPQAFNGITLTPNRAETQRPTAASSVLVPPHNINPKIKLTVTSGDPNISIAPLEKTLTLNVVGSKPIGNPATYANETKEEYLRVLFETQATLDQALPNKPSYREFLENFVGSLSSFDATKVQALKDHARQRGAELWDMAVEVVQAGKGDDRALYWSRLQAVTSLRKHCRVLGIGEANTKAIVKEFEYASRNIQRIKFGGGKRVLLLGFDPFDIGVLPKRGNSSGVAAIACSNIRISLDGTSSANVQTLILPVRYADFDDGIVEDAVKDLVAGLDLLMTSSQGREGRYDIERYASAKRGNGIDNNSVFTPKQPTNYFPVTKPEPSFFESRLPFSALIYLPTMPAPGSSTQALVFNQGFATESKTRFDSLPGNADAFVPIPLDASDTGAPDPGDKLLSGSTGKFLSNEAHYRTSRVCYEKNGKLPYGHLHFPLLPDTDDKNTRDGLINATQALLKEMLEGKDLVLLPPLQMEGKVFKLQETTYSVRLPQNYPADKATVAVAPQLLAGSITDAFTIMPAAQTITLSKTEETPVFTVFFGPTSERYFALAVFLVDANSKRLLRINLVGRGKMSPAPAPDDGELTA
ncbi:MAG TPA: IPT/TIG domain-containing protein [Anaerolineae bacterium]|nr:IPT/TIG domain-containing protein [Anaerolineae bacterium]